MSTIRTSAVARTESRRRPLATAPKDSPTCLDLVRQEPDSFVMPFMNFVGLRGSRQDYSSQSFFGGKTWKPNHRRQVLPCSVHISSRRTAATAKQVND